MKKLHFLLLFFTVSFFYAQEVAYDEITPLEDYNFVLGTQGIGGFYKFTNESALVEQAKHIRAMGSNILKITLAKRSPKVYGLPIKSVNSTKELFLSSKDYKRVFDMDFKYIFAWVHTLTGINWGEGFNKKEEKIIYDEMYEFTTLLLNAYNNTGKTFLIGNWEGDWLLSGAFDKYKIPSKTRVKNMTKWFKIRQKAIDDAKKNTKHTNVSLYHLSLIHI